MSRARRLAMVASIALSAACGDRPDVWTQTAPSDAPAFALASSVAVIDDAAHRVITLAPEADERLTTRAFPVGHHVSQAAASPDGARLFVLASGDVPRRSQDDELPSMTVLDASGASATSRRYTMAAPLSKLAIDPEGRWVAAFAGGASFVENPNEIVLFDLNAPPSATNPIARTLRSFGGTPQRLTFSPTLQLPGGPRRLLVVETQEDVTLLDLDHAADSPPRPEITVRLTNGGDTRQPAPAQVAIDDGDPARTDDARIAVRTSNDTNVITLELAPSAAGSPNDFEPKINLTDVGGPASDLAFVRTDGGLRVAALVPSRSTAVLVEPDTSLVSTVKLPAPYARMSRVTNVVQGPGGGTDVALLWSGTSTGGVAFWTLGKTAGQPYRSVEVVALDGTIDGALDVPPPNDVLKVLATATGGGFYVLNLRTRTAAPLTSSGAARLSVSPDGGRLWAFQPGGSALAMIDLATVHPVPLSTDRPIRDLFDVARSDGGRSLVVLHGAGGIGATVFDANAPDTATARTYSGLLLEGL